ncbi:hypothetical protein [Paludibacterium sp.]|uniref:hypothetical protein n=1 Tax=Paludibacterium sp. TaxID=1917523 RepID=UPI0025EEB58A|nr:hypothetical protein [Paludibacterium sp.]MBV8647843.1 hypothetical protein [Paludibacterium sp.]
MNGNTAQIIEFRVHAHQRNKQPPPKPVAPVSDRLNHLMHNTVLTIIDYVAEKTNVQRHEVAAMLVNRYKFQSPMDLTVEQMDDAIRFLIDFVDDKRMAY